MLARPSIYPFHVSLDLLNSVSIANITVVNCVHLLYFLLSLSSGMDWNEIYLRQIDNGFNYNGFAAIFLGGLRILLLT